VLVGVGVVLGHVLWPRQVERVVYERGPTQVEAPAWDESSGVREVRRGVVVPARLGKRVVEGAGRVRRRCVEAVRKVFEVCEGARGPQWVQ